MEKKIFKKLVVYNFLSFITFSIYLLFLQSEEIIRLNERFTDRYVSPIFMSTMGFILFFVHLFSFYFLYNFKKAGRLIFTTSIILLLILSLFSPIAFDGIGYIIDSINGLLAGGILTLMYFTNLSKEFK